MYRHELRFVLRFGIHGQFSEFAQRLYQEETARGWAPPRVWRATSGHVNQIVIEHDYTSLDAFRRERARLPRRPWQRRRSPRAAKRTGSAGHRDRVRVRRCRVERRRRISRTRTPDDRRPTPARATAMTVDREKPGAPSRRGPAPTRSSGGSSRALPPPEVAVWIGPIACTSRRAGPNFGPASARSP
jgi:hypothetical protein